MISKKVEVTYGYLDLFVSMGFDFSILYVRRKVHIAIKTKPASFLEVIEF